MFNNNSAQNPKFATFSATNGKPEKTENKESNEYRPLFGYPHFNNKIDKPTHTGTKQPTTNTPNKFALCDKTQVTSASLGGGLFAPLSQYHTDRPSSDGLFMPNSTKLFSDAPMSHNKSESNSDLHNAPSCYASSFKPLFGTGPNKPLAPSEKSSNNELNTEEFKAKDNKGKYVKL
jgi:hypothetical protein